MRSVVGVVLAVREAEDLRRDAGELLDLALRELDLVAEVGGRDARGMLVGVGVVADLEERRRAEEARVGRVRSGPVAAHHERGGHLLRDELVHELGVEARGFARYLAQVEGQRHALDALVAGEDERAGRGSGGRGRGRDGGSRARVRGRRGLGARRRGLHGDLRWRGGGAGQQAATRGRQRERQGGRDESATQSGHCPLPVDGFEDFGREAASALLKIETKVEKRRPRAPAL